MLQPIPDEASCHRCNGDSRHEGLPHDVVPLRDLKEQLLSAQVSISRVFSCCFQQCIDIQFTTRRRNHRSTSNQADESTRPCEPEGSLIPFQVAFKSVFRRLNLVIAMDLSD